MARLANRRVERGLEADLRPDAGGVAGCDGDFRLIAHARARLRLHGDGSLPYCHGISEAWITSGTPSPPTDLMARSTSLNPNLWVVTFSSGKRLDASCAKASSQALKL